MSTAREDLNLVQLIEKYATVSVQEAPGLLETISKNCGWREHDACAEFLTSIGSEINIIEPMPRLRLAARRALVNCFLPKLFADWQVLDGVIRAAECCIDFFGVREHVAKLTDAELQTLRVFLSRAYKAHHDLYKKGVSVSNPTSLVAAIVNARYVELLLTEQILEGIIWLYSYLQNELNRVYPQGLYMLQSSWFRALVLPEDDAALVDELRNVQADMARINLICGHNCTRQCSSHFRTEASVLLQLASVAMYQLKSECESRFIGLTDNDQWHGVAQNLLLPSPPI
ncbi:MAG: hypothetical protein WCW27_00780 [Patescibacteria group bacterium]|jgi:hypothetical protein